MSSELTNAEAKPKHDFAKLKDILVREDIFALQNVPYGKYEPLEPEQQEEINELALGYATNLSIVSVLATVRDVSWKTNQDTMGWQGFLVKQNNRELSERDQRNHWAAETLRQLCVRRLVSDPRVIPYLIDALDHPSRFQVAEKSLQALRALTRRMIIPGAPGNVFGGPRGERDEQIISWWKYWWNENKDKHPVFDSETEEKARAEMLRLANAIKEKVKPTYPELEVFTVPTQLELNDLQPLFRIEYNPKLYSPINSRLHSVGRNNLPWLEICCAFETPEWVAPWTERVRSSLPKEPVNVVDVYQSKLAGSDIVVKVRIASPNRVLMADIEKAVTTSQP